MTALTTSTPILATMPTVIETGGLDMTLRVRKLSGMLDTIDARLAQARAGELGHLEFLQVLCEDEISRRHATSISPAAAQRPLRGTSHARRLRLHRQPETARRADP